MGHYIEEAKNMNSIDALSAPSFLIESAKTELQLFEGLIELDFAEVYNENGIISLSEADQESASEQSDQAQNNFIKNIWKKFTDTIKKMLKSIKEKFNEFTKKLADKKVDRDKYIKDEKARSCSIIYQ